MNRVNRGILLLLAAASAVSAQECTFIVSPVRFDLPATGDAALARTLTVNASRGGCAWTAVSGVSWIAVSFGQAGSNDGTVGIRVDPNRDAVTRSGSLTIAGQTISVLQAAATCTFTLNPESAIVNVSGGNGSFQVNTTCNWQAVTNVDWIDVTSPAQGRGSGNGLVTFTVRANAGAARTGTIQVGPLRFSVQQSAGACSQTLSLTQVNLPATGGNGTVQVTSPCLWTASSNATWISITGGGSADRDGTLAYSVQANTQAQPRSGTIRIGNQTFTVNQTGTGCAVALTPTNATIAATGGNGAILVSSGCTWTATPNEPWISITPAASIVNYVVASNTGGNPRTGSIAIGDQLFTITQAAGACSVTVSPASAQVAAGGGGGNFLVSGQPGCQWTVATPADWITLNIGSGDGSGTVIYSVPANPGSSRTAAINVSAQSFTITQAGAIPSFTAAGVLSAASFEAGAVAPGLIVTIFGSGLGPSTLTVATVDPVARIFPTDLAGTRVLFDGVAAPLLYVSATQLSTVTPFAVAGRQITRMEVETRGVRSQTVFLPVRAAAPGIFTQSAQGFGPGAILNQDYTVNGPGNPAAPGSFVFIYATGGGIVEPATEDGRLSQGTSAAVTRVTAEVGGQPADVIYAGGAPDLVAGVLQVNIRLPVDLPPGDLPLLIRAGVTDSQARVSVSIR